MALPVIVLGFLIAATPYYLFPVCTGRITAVNGAFLPMKCFWTAKAALGCGGVIVCAGIIIALASSPGVCLGVALTLLPISALVTAFPTVHVGVCQNEMMPCRMGTLPALCLLGILTGVFALIMALWRHKQLRNSGENP
ncbi:MAG: DUF4418 family protein [Desulfovibrio sp.]|jgi:hypothetical protein|nr:DUF4418 family protein [Desulfovibrio sp.]